MAEYTFIPNLVSALPEVPGDAILSKSLQKDGDVDVTLFFFAAGQELTAHTSPIPAIIHVLDGQLELTLGKDVLSAGPGRWAHMPANLPHALKALTPVKMLLTMIKD